MSADLFGSPAQSAAVAGTSRARLHDETDIYRSVAELSKYIARTTSNLRRDLKPTYGVLLVDKVNGLAVLVRAANIARGAAKLPLLETILEEIEYIQFTLKTLDELGQEWLPHSTYAASIPLTASIGRQAHGLKAHFAPAS